MAAFNEPLSKRKATTDEQSIIYLRTTTRPEVPQQQIYTALGIKPDPLGKRKTIVNCKKSVVPTDSS